MSITQTEHQGYASRKEATADLKRTQDPIFGHLGIIDPYYALKNFHYRKGGTRKEGLYVDLFDWELELETDIYTETVKSQTFLPEDPERGLYKLPHLPNWNNVYKKIDTDKYSVPLSKFIKIGVNGKILTQALPIRDYAGNIPNPSDMRVVKDESIALQIIVKHLNALSAELSLIINPKSK